MIIGDKLYDEQGLPLSQIKIEGDLNLSNYKIITLPNIVIVQGDLNLFNCNQLTSLGSKLYVQGILDLRYCSRITELPSDLKAEFIDLKGCFSLKEIPAGLQGIPVYNPLNIPYQTNTIKLLED